MATIIIKVCETCGKSFEPDKRCTLDYRKNRARFCNAICAGVYHAEKSLGKFWGRVEKKENSCWDWAGCLNNMGYGVLNFNRKKMQTAHRVAFWLTFPEKRAELAKMFVLHSCDNRACVNPDHLSLGTHLDNVQDMVRKGRQCSGEKQGRSKLKNEQVYEIRRLYAGQKITYQNLADRFGVSLANIRKIILRLTWKHI